MCGIAGFNWDNRILIKRMSLALKHRGPDQNGFYISRKISLAHRRLSIVDLSEKAKQPFYNEDKSIILVCNGEIYNHKEIREELQKKNHKFLSSSDNEVIVHAYEEYGTNCLQAFNGDFAFAIYDSRRNIIFLARDRLGAKPLYYYNKDSRFMFASEIKAIIQNPDIKREVNLESLNKFITLRYIPGEETMFKNISRLLSGHFMIYDMEREMIHIEKYWDVNPGNENIVHKSKKYFADNLLNLFEDSVKKRLMSDVPLGVYLSGGLDSSAILAMMRSINPEQKIKTFSVGFEHDTKSELKPAKFVSDYFKTEHKEFMISSKAIKLLPKIIWHLDEPMSDPACVPSYILSAYAKKKVSVVLTGDGGDDLFAGYDQWKFPVIANKFGIFKHILPFIIEITPNFILNRIYGFSSETGKKMFERFRKFISSKNKAKAYLEVVSIFDEDERNELLKENVKAQINDFTHYDELNEKYFNNKQNYLNQLLYMELKRYLPEDLLMKPDKTCSASAVEARAPFLDYRLAEFSFKMPPSLKLNGFTAKYILRKALKNILPEKILKRKKQPFQVPLGHWIEKDLKPFFKEFLSKKNIEKQGYFNYSYIEKIFRNYDKSKLFYGRQLWNLLNFSIWHKIYIEGEKISSIIK